MYLLLYNYVLQLGFVIEAWFRLFIASYYMYDECITTTLDKNCYFIISRIIKSMFVVVILWRNLEVNVIFGIKLHECFDNPWPE